MKSYEMSPEKSELGKTNTYDPYYNPEKLFPIPRKMKRDEIGVPATLPFYGYDLWNHYEVSWLNEKGKPVVALAEIIYPCESPNIIESKSMKLYFNSFNNTKFKNKEIVCETIKSDLSKRVGADVEVKVLELKEVTENKYYPAMAGICLDDLDINCENYQIKSDYLSIESAAEIEETIFSNLLKSNCLVTHQPDWASVQISYHGNKINHEGLLKYLISFRNHNEFHEQCVERIFMDIMHHCRPTALTIYARYTRRGGLDINPIRSTHPIIDIQDKNRRLCRQ